MKIKDPKDVAESKINDLNCMSIEEQKARNEALYERDRRVFTAFSNSFSKGICESCQKSLDSFDAETPCYHWLLAPAGFKKGNFKEIINRFGLFRVQCYLRWVANQENYAKNINDLSVGDYLIRETIKWKHLEWSISCQKGDLDGHGNAPESQQPHYHFQMRIRGRSFIKFNDFHCPLSYEDMVQLWAIKSPNAEWQGHPFGDGMGAVMAQEPRKILDTMTTTDEPDAAMFSVDTLVLAKDGTTIKGEDILKIIENAKETGESFAVATRKLKDVQIQTTIEPGPGVAKEAPRKSGRSKRNRGGN